jgi:DNA-binding transcriptional LysR family regulator
MELRHLRYFLAVGEAQNFTKAAALLGVAQPALSRQVRLLEDELGVHLLKRSSRGVALTAGGKLFMAEAREVLKHAADSVEKVRAQSRGQYGELHIGYAPSVTIELLPPALTAFQKAEPRVNILTHDLSSRDITKGLLNGTLELALMPEASSLQIAGLQYEPLIKYPLCVALPKGHPLARLKSISLEKLAAQPLVGLRTRDYPEYAHIRERVFSPLGVKPRVTVECDSGNSVITAIQGGRGVTFVPWVFKQLTGKRLIYRPLTGTTEVFSVGIVRATAGELTPAGKKFCEILRKVSKQALAKKVKAARVKEG